MGEKLRLAQKILRSVDTVHQLLFICMLFDDHYNHSVDMRVC